MNAPCGKRMTGKGAKTMTTFELQHGLARLGQDPGPMGGDWG